MILRLSQKLNTKIKAGTLKPMPPDENPYADWSCHLFTADRTQYIIVCNTQSLYSSVLYGKGITSDSVFIERVLSSRREFMEDDGQSFIYQRFVAPSSGLVSFAKPLNRSVIGSMNDLILHATDWLDEGEVAPHDVGFGLIDIPLSAVASGKQDRYAKPSEAFRTLAEVYRSSGV
jgi:hypothetical protein